jgi:PKD domain
MPLLHSILNRLVPALAALTILLMSSLASPVHAQGAKPAFPRIELAERKSHGQRAIDLLRDRLPEVAAFYRKSPDELRAMLLKDRTLKVDGRGRLFVEEELEAPLKSFAAPTGSAGALNGTLAPLDQTFLLHSRPGAKRTIYLNFRGATLNNTAWNSGGTINAPPFDLDGIPYSFSTAELQRIQYIWQRVVEDYAPFDVDVTTEPPPAESITRAGTGDDTFGTTVLITSRSGVYNCSCGGVAYLGIFDDTTDFYKPALVFHDALGPGDEKFIAEAISHEAGHNMGLAHDGFSGGGYYTGQGSGATGWAPIMGVGYYKSLVQWSKGEYATANNVQDDFGVMQSNGLPLRADDHGNTTGTATLLTGTSAGGITSLSAEGVIERASDIDMFTFTSGAGSATFAIAGAVRSSNLDALLEVRNGAGNLLASANPVDALSATVTVNLPTAGTYYVSLRGSGKGDPMVDGYTNYGSLGQYLLSASVPTASGQAPVAVVSATPSSGTAPLTVAFSGTGSTDADGTIVAYDWTFGDGTVGSGATTTKVYNSVGSFTAQLRVEDNTGLSATRNVTITVNAPVVVVSMGVSSIGMSLTVQKNGVVRANAAVTVFDDRGLVVPNATVTGKWSGVVAANRSAVSDGSGTATFTSPGTRSEGTFVFTVTRVTAAGYQYQPSRNIETSDSITR